MDTRLIEIEYLVADDSTAPSSASVSARRYTRRVDLESDTEAKSAMGYLASVISRLYRPSAVRQVFALSRRDAEKIPALPSVAVISITTPANGPAALAEFEHLLRLSFEDVNHLDPDLSERAKAKLAGSFSTQHAEQIHRFVQKSPLNSSEYRVAAVCRKS